MILASYGRRSLNLVGFRLRVLDKGHALHTLDFLICDECRALDRRSRFFSEIEVIERGSIMVGRPDEGPYQGLLAIPRNAHQWRGKDCSVRARRKTPLCARSWRRIWRPNQLSARSPGCSFPKRSRLPKMPKCDSITVATSVLEDVEEDLANAHRVASGSTSTNVTRDSRARRWRRISAAVKSARMCAIRRHGDAHLRRDDVA